MKTQQDTLKRDDLLKYFQEIGKRFEEQERYLEEQERYLNERRIEDDKQFKELKFLWQETDKRFKETDGRMKLLQSLFEGQWGKLVESLVEGDLITLLHAKDIDVTETHTRVKRLYNNMEYEIDILACNSHEIVPVEVKTTLNTKKVKIFLNKLKKFKEVFPIYKLFKVYGAIAFIREEESSAIYAEKNGLWVIKATGKSASIINKVDFKPRSF